MSIVVNRMDLLAVLDMVSPGISKVNFIEQSSCFVFHAGSVFTYNDEISCRAASPLPEDFSGAVDAKPLAAALRQYPDDEVTLKADGDKLVIRGKNKRTRIAFQQNVILDTSAVEDPAEWRKLPPEFAEAVEVVHACSSPKHTPFALNCVHIYPKYMEATDTLQLARFRIKLGLSEPVMVRRDSIKHAVPLGVVDVAETANWLHFRTEDGLVFACRLDRQQLDSKGQSDGYLAADPDATAVTLPKGLVPAVDRAAVFSAEVKDSKVLVQLRPGEVRVEGVGTTGDHKERRAMKYAGKPRDFLIAPALLAKIVSDHSDCEIGDSKIRIAAGRWTYVAALARVKKEK